MFKNKRKHKKQPQFMAKLTMSGASATLDVSGVIGWDTEAVAFNDKVAAAKAAGCTSLTVRINSLGGYCYDGLAMGDCLKNCGMETTGVVVGTAQSMASFLLQCCDKRTAHKNATLMFHQPSAGAWGTVDEIMEQARHLTAMRDTMFNIMAARCGTTGQELSQEHTTMKIYTAEEALAKGFLDSIEGEDAPAPAPEEPLEQDEQDATASAKGCIMFDPRRSLFAMLAEDEDEPTEEGEDEDEPKEPTEEGEDEDEPKEPEEGEDEDKPKEPTEEGEDEDEPKEPTEEGEDEDEPKEPEEGEDEDEPKEPEENPAAKDLLTRDEVAKMITANNTALMAALGVPLTSLPSAATASGAIPARKPSMEELDAMPPYDRMILLQQDPDLARQYLNH